MLSRRAVIKFGFFGFISISILLLVLSIFFSSATLFNDSYFLGEKIKISPEGNIQKISIKTPTESLLLKYDGKPFFYEPSEIGSYQITLEENGKEEVYHFIVYSDDEDNFVEAKKINSLSKNGFNFETDVLYSEISNISLTRLSDMEKVNDFELIDQKNGSFDLHLSDRAYRPGIYKINIDSSNLKYSKEFAYGLLSINTKKSTYTSGDEALLEIVVLDSNGVGVCGSNIKLDLSDPNNNVYSFSTEKDIFSGEECGLYYLNYKTSINGEHFIKAITFVEDYEVSFDTSFLVDDNLSYEIVRDTLSKIDPTQQDWFDVNINVSSFIGDEKLEIIEYVPSVFNVTSEQIFEVSDVNGTKILRWIVDSEKAEIKYSYSVPNVWPYLYELGPLEVNGFKEFRPWYVAVDPIINVANVSSQDIKIATFDNRTFALGWIQPSPLSLQFRVYDTNGTNLTGNITVTTGLDADSRFALTAINSTNMIFAWTDGDAASEDGNARGYLVNGTPWFNQFEFESGVGTPAVDVDIIPMVDRYHICYLDDAEGDADIRTYLYSSPTTLSGAENNLDTGANPDVALRNMFRCAAINESRFAAFWFDDSGDTASFAILNRTNGVITAQTNLEAVGTDGQVAVTGLNNELFAMAWYRSSSQNIRMSIRNRNNGVVSAISTISANAGRNATIEIATVKNRSVDSDWFVVAWNNQNSSVINATVFNSTGSLEHSYALETNENTTNLLFDIKGRESLSNTGICDESYIFAYHNSSGSIVTKTLKLDGTEWSGECDFTPPTLTVNSPLNTNYSNSTVLFNITLNERGSFVSYTLNEGLNNISMSTLNNINWNATNTSISDGNYLVRFYANNSNGLINDTVTVKFTIDTIVPFIEIISPQFNHSNFSVNNIEFNLTTDGIVNYCNYTLNEGLNNYSMSSTDLINWNATNTSIADGLYTTIFYCFDFADNLGLNSTAFRIDTTPPSVNISSPSSRNYTYSTIDINFTSFDSGIGVSSCWYSIDDGLTNITLNNCENNTFLANQDTNIFRFFSNDTLGNINDSLNFTFFVDSIVPLVSFVAPTPTNGAGIEFTSFLVNVSVTETNFANITFELYNISGGINELVNRTIFTSLVNTINFTNLDNNNKNYTFNVTVIDTLGNTNFTPTRTITLTPGDTNPPIIFFNSPPANGYFYNSSSVYFQITLSEIGNTVWYRLNNSLINYTMNTSDNLIWNATNTSIADGNYELIINANDTIGNLGTRTRNFTIDTTRPLIDYTFGTSVNSANVSSNSIFVNVSVTETNFANITFELYNTAESLINSFYYEDFTRNVTFEALSDGTYYYNVSVRDLANNFNSTETRTISLDTTNPQVLLSSPIDGLMSNVSLQNLTANITDNLLLQNITLLVYNNTGFLINTTNFFVNGNEFNFGIEFLFPYDGYFNWSFVASDAAGNYNSTQNYTIYLDTINPIINYVSPTPSNNTQYEADSIYVNVTVTEINFANITFELYNNTAGLTLVNSTTFNDSTKEINFTGLNSANVTYYFISTAYDFLNNKNSTEIRTVKLIDSTRPSLDLIDPQNRTYFTNQSLALTYTASDIHLSSCWYSVDQTSNISLPDCLNTEFNVSEGQHTLYLYVNDTLGLLNQTSVTFISNSSLFKPYGGILSYGEGTVQIPRYRFWNGTGFTSEVNASSVGGTIQWLRVKSSPSREEQIIVTADTNFDINVQINSTFLNGTNCWHNGTTCGAVLELETASSLINRSKMDVAYEVKGDDAIVVWSQGNSTPGYRKWNGTSWSDESVIPQTLLSGDINYLKMASHPFREEVALIMTNTSDLSALIWNGTSWGCEPSNRLSRILTPETYQHADVVYEQASGDLFIASNANGFTEVNFTTKLDGSCSYSTSTTTTLLEESELISIGARYGSNHIMVVQQDGGADDMHAIVWNGTAMVAISGNEGTLYPEVIPSELISASWAGTSNNGLLVYSDAATSLNLDYMLYNITTNSWDGGVNGLNAFGITNFSDEEQNIKSYSYIDQNRSLVIVQDDLDDLWAKAYDADTRTWIQPDNGAALETTVASTTFPALDFEFNYDRFGPQIFITSYNYYVNSSSLLFNITLGETVSICNYNLDSGVFNTMNQYSSKIYFANMSGLLEGQHNVTFNCTDIRENSRDSSTSFVIDTIKPLINFSASTELNNSVFERDWIYSNVSVTETNFANITFELYNNTSGLTLVNRTTFNDSTRALNWTNLTRGIYFYNVSVRDLANNFNSTETRTINLTRVNPIVNLSYPSNGLNISGFTINQFNFSVSDDNSLSNCSLYGNWTTGWHLNQTIVNPQRDTLLNFSSVLTNGDGFYIWNVYCYDSLGNLGLNSTNYTFSTFLPTNGPRILNITQTSIDGKGNITLTWNSSNHSLGYRIYYSSNMTHFVLLNETTNLNYTDSSFNGSIRRFYRIDSFNPINQNSSQDYFGAHVYTFHHNVNTKNMIGFPTNVSYLTNANSSLNNIPNSTAFTMWNSTLQIRTTCNSFSCPNFPSCTSTNCNFPLSKGYGYEVNINASSNSPFNWSVVGVVYNKSVLNLIKNSTSFGKNWAGFYANTTLINAIGILQNTTNSDSISNWNAQLQTSQGLIKNPFGPGFIGNNFAVILEKAYEISVNQTINWTQI